VGGYALRAAGGNSLSLPWAPLPEGLTNQHIGGEYVGDVGLLESNPVQSNPIQWIGVDWTGLDSKKLCLEQSRPWNFLSGPRSFYTVEGATETLENFL